MCRSLAVILLGTDIVGCDRFLGHQFNTIRKIPYRRAENRSPSHADGLQKLSHFGAGLLVPVKVVVKKILTWALCKLSFPSISEPLLDPSVLHCWISCLRKKKLSFL